jgi:predicted  nucleic acid-binding Zn-ribbon protein
MASKQELELQVLDLQRQVKELTQAAAASGPDTPVDVDTAALRQTQDELRSALERESSLKKSLQDAEARAASLKVESDDLRKKIDQRPPPSKEDGPVKLERMQAWELVDLVKYQFLPKDAEVAVIRNS